MVAHHINKYNSHHHDFTKTADLPIASISRQSMIASPLHINSHKVKTPAALFCLKKVVSVE